MLPNKPIQDLLSYLSDKFANLSGTLNEQELTNKCNQLIGTKINEADISLIKLFLESLFIRMRLMKLNLEENNKVSQLKNRVKQLEKDNKETKTLLDYHENEIRKLKNDTNQLVSTTTGLENKFNKLTNIVEIKKEEENDRKEIRSDIKFLKSQISKLEQHLKNKK